MRILAVRGRNLASLAGDFELDLQGPPFERAGLFAITGPVGSGKSTLLDAMCLALFDRTPRLTGRGGAAVGSPQDREDLRLASNDVRTILRRGTVEGHAEVDFRGRDGRRYRARWSVRRARRRADGRLQQQRAELRDLDSDRVLHADRKQETLAAIRERLGLSFDQFRRSVMLAQGDFAAFLESDAKDRAELLERMTGTEIYRKISQKAYDRYREEERRLRSLRDMAEMLRPLETAERAALQRRFQEAGICVTVLSADQAAAKKACEWHDTLHELVENENRAARSHERAKTAWAATSDNRHELARAQSAQPLRPMVDALGQARKELGQAIANHTVAAEELNRICANEMACGEASSAADSEFEKLEKMAKSLASELEEARELDGRLAEARLATKTLENQHLQARRESESTAVVVRGHRTELDGLAKAEDRILDWFTQHDSMKGLVGDWERYREDLSRIREVLVGRAETETRCCELSERHEEELRSLRAAREMTVVKREVLEKARDRMEGVRQRLQGLSVSDLRRRQKLLGEERKSLERARKVNEEIRESTGRAAELEALLANALRESGAAAEKLEEVVASLEKNREELEEALRALRSSEASRSLVDHRKDLRDGEPCPLCGSTSHRISHQPSARAVSEQGRRVEDLTAAQRALLARELGLREAKATWDERAEAWRVESSASAARLRLSTDEWGAMALVSEGGLPRDPLDETLIGEIQAQTRQIDRSSADLEREQEQVDSLMTASQAAGAAMQEAQSAWVQAVDLLKSAEESERRIAEDLGQTDEELRRMQSVEKELLAGLGIVFRMRVGWRESLCESPEAFADECRAMVEHWMARTQQLESSRKRSEVVARMLAEGEAQQAERTRTEARVAAQLQERRTALLELERRRSALLDGRPAAEVENETSSSLEKAGKLRQERARAWKRAQMEHAESLVRFQHATQGRERSRRAVQEAEGRLQCAAESADIPLQDLETRLSHDPAWIRARERELAAKRQSLERAETILGERRSRRRRHEANGRPSLKAREAGEELSRVEHTLSEASEELARLRVELAKDDEVRDRLGELEPRIAAQADTANIWQALNELIGSARGDRFQVFAQSLTLEALLTLANHHLRELSRRYRIERVPNTDLELQVVDQEMGEAVRSIHSLSGGESFLVSLAMALGLSSLSARHTQIETLFIDEGFGTLDPVSLETALSALDALQAGGRQVGIISHVDGLAERVGTHVQVIPQGGGRSRLQSVG